MNIAAYSNPGADVDVYLVKNMPSQTAARFPGSKATFIAENTKSGISSPLSALAQEVGHVLAQIRQKSCKNLPICSKNTEIWINGLHKSLIVSI